MKNRDSVYKYTKMEMFTSVNLRKIKNMDAGHFFGSVSAPHNPNKYNSIMGIGGEGCLMVQVNTRKQMVVLY